MVVAPARDGAVHLTRGAVRDPIGDVSQFAERREAMTDFRLADIPITNPDSRDLDAVISRIVEPDRVARDLK